MKRRIQILAILMVAVMLLTACGKKVEAPELLIPVENPDAVYTAVKQKLKTTYVKEGSVCPEVVDLKFDYDSEVYDVQVQIGDFVKEGDLLFRLDEELEIKLKEAEAELTLRKKNYEVAVKQHNDQIKNMIWEISVAEDELPRVSEMGQVCSLTREGERICVKLLADQRPELSEGMSCRPARPNLEDVYLHYFGTVNDLWDTN